jgi:hypothetical protein
MMRRQPDSAATTYRLEAGQFGSWGDLFRPESLREFIRHSVAWLTGTRQNVHASYGKAGSDPEEMLLAARSGVGPQPEQIYIVWADTGELVFNSLQILLTRL